MSIKRRTRLEKKRALILETAKEVLIKNGKNTTMTDIAQELEMDTSSLYYYYKGIPEIMNALLLNEYHDLSALHKDLSEAGQKPHFILKEMVSIILEFYYDNQEIMQIILTQVSPLFLDEDYQEASVAINNYLDSYRITNGYLLEEIKKGQASKDLTLDFTPEMILHSIRGFILGICAAWSEEKPPREMLPSIAYRVVTVFT
jgi:AcrR family transcriptional regulator